MLDLRNYLPSLVGVALIFGPLWAFANGDEPLTEPSAEVSAPCPILASSDWAASIEEETETGEQELVVKGKITLPTPGFQIAAELGPLDRRQPPAQIVRLELTPPDGLVTQVLTTEDISLSVPALASRYRSVVLVCGEGMLAEITDIMSAQ